MIHDSRPLSEIYSILLAEHRRLCVSFDSGAACCQWCGKSRKEHLPDSRCSTYALSQEFIPTWDEDKKKIERALSPIEELRALL